jgi:tRNA-binding protein
VDEYALTWQEFERVDMRVGRVLQAEPLAGARQPAYSLEIDFGPEVGVKRSSAQVTHLYSPDQIIGRQVIAVVNFAPKRIAGYLSQVLVLGVAREGGEVVLLALEREVPLGGRVF